MRLDGERGGGGGGEAEVGKLEEAPRVEEEVLRLDVPVHHVAQVQVPQDVRRLSPTGARRGGAEGEEEQH
eukprot:3855807-Rhodomonas_salina.1